MEQFEVWWNKKHDIKELEATYKITTSEELIDALAELAWEAALKWVLQIKITSDNCVYLDMLRNRIRKELKDN